MDLPTTFRERLLLARVNAGLERQELALRVGLHRYTIGRLERGETRSIDIEALGKIALVLDVTTDWLLALDTLRDRPDDDTVLAAPHAAAHVTSVLHAG